MHDHADDYDEAGRVTWISIVINTLLGVGKVIAGLLGNSWAVVADGLHTLSDLVSSVGILIGLRIARRAPDKTHPYGHGKAETLAARFVAFMLVAVAGLIVYEATHRLIYHTIELPQQIALWAAGASILVKEGLFRFKRYYARKTGSSALAADAWHHRSDALTSIAALAGVAGAILSDGRLRWLDPAAALIVGAVIIWVTLRILRETAGELMDGTVRDEITDGIRALAAQVPGVLGVEQIRCRKAGLSYLCDIHVEVDPKMPVDEAHKIAASVRDKLITEGDNILQALVHIEPYYPDDH